MKSFRVATAVALAFGVVAPTASAQPVRGINFPPILIEIPPIFLQPSACKHFDKSPCKSDELSNPWFKQVVLLSAGFEDADRDAFWAEFDRTIDQMTSASTAGSVWSVQKKQQLLFVGYFTGGGALGTARSTFGAHVMVHPIRGYGLALSQDDVHATINQIKSNEIAALRPFAAAVLFNTYQSPVSAPASIPSFADKPYGIAKFTRHDVESSPYTLTHELAHAGLSFLDEYTEAGLENQSVRSLDALTPLLQLDGTWDRFASAIPNFFSVYNIQLSEILANNGNDNVTMSRFPSSVWTPGYAGEDYAYESGMFFGHGTWHMPGANLMNDNFVTRAPNDGFAFAHSPAQQRVVDLAFGNSQSVRPNDRLLNAGPVSGWPLAFGSTTHVMMRDADMHHQFQPTQSYTVQVGWYERHWRTCWAGFVPYPCYDNVWTTAAKTVGRAKRSIDLKMSSAYGVASLAQNVMCGLGITQIKSTNGPFKLCETDISTVTDAFLPTATFSVPYQDVDVPATQWMTTYWWRFSTNNGVFQSGNTAWSSFFRSL